MDELGKRLCISLSKATQLHEKLDGLTDDLKLTASVALFIQEMEKNTDHTQILAMLAEFRLELGLATGALLDGDIADCLAEALDITKEVK